jgi:hypothetical protein
LKSAIPAEEARDREKPQTAEKLQPSKIQSKAMPVLLPIFGCAPSGFESVPGKAARVNSAFIICSDGVKGKGAKKPACERSFYDRNRSAIPASFMRMGVVPSTKRWNSVEFFEVGLASEG